MSASTQIHLAALSAHAIWSRDPAWLQVWYDRYYAPACRDSLFLPPLLALDLCSAMDRGVRKPGSRATARNGFTAWSDFLEWLNARALAALETRTTSISGPFSPGTWRILRSFGLALLNRDWRCPPEFASRSGGLLPEAILAAESARCDGEGPCPALDDCWVSLDQDAIRGSLKVWIPEGVLLSLGRPQGGDVDPFLVKLLYDEMEPERDTPKSITGSKPKSQHHRMRLGAAGEFAKRDLGGLPSDLGRLAPTELMYLAAGDPPAPAAAAPRGRLTAPPRPTGIEIPRERALRARFVMKMSQGGLLQRFSRVRDPSVMEPHGRLHVEITDRPELHQLHESGHPPLISWYRAVLIQLVHQLARLCAEAGWSIEVALVHSFGENLAAAIIPSDHRDHLAASVAEARDLVIGVCPDAFRAGWASPSRSLPAISPFPPEMDFGIRVQLGGTCEQDHAAKESLHFRPRVHWAARVEKAHSGVWGMALGNDVSEAPTLEITEMNCMDDNPATAAACVLRSLLGIEDPTDLPT